MFNNRPFLFQQDGAPDHTAKVNQEWLRRNILEFISKEEWPPSSTGIGVAKGLLGVAGNPSVLASNPSSNPC